MPGLPSILGTDVGGTFTDFVLITGSGDLHCFKVPSTPSRPGASILGGVDEIQAALNAEGQAWSQMVHTHSSTVATNALIERKGAKVGLLVSAGFRDLFELQRLAIPHPMRFDSRRPQPLVPRALVREIGGRIDADGREVEPLDTAAVVRAAADLKAAGVDIAIVVFLHSYRNPAHERAARDAAGAILPVELSSDVWPQAREYERGVLTAINATIRPMIEGYVDRLVTGLRQRRIETPARIARSNGGAELAASLRDRPVVALLSGPAAGVSGAAEVARDAGWDDADLMTLDIGGTSADIGIVRGGRAVLSSEEHIADFPVLIPTVAVSSIGAGGGSIIWRRPDRLAEGRSAQCRRRSRPRLLRHERLADPGPDRRVSGSRAAGTRPAPWRQAAAAASARARSDRPYRRRTRQLARGSGATARSASPSQ